MLALPWAPQHGQRNPSQAPSPGVAAEEAKSGNWQWTFSQTCSTEPKSLQQPLWPSGPLLQPALTRQPTLSLLEPWSPVPSKHLHAIPSSVWLVIKKMISFESNLSHSEIEIRKSLLFACLFIYYLHNLRMSSGFLMVWLWTTFVAGPAPVTPDGTVDQGSV